MQLEFDSYVRLLLEFLTENETNLAEDFFFDLH